MFRNRQMLTCAGLALLVALNGASLLAAEDANGVTRGRVVDAKEAPVTGAAVILCRQADGMPFAKDKQRTFVESIQAGGSLTDLAFVLSDERGRFTFEGLRHGEYRLMAQTWQDADSIEGILEVNGQVVELLGIAENVRVLEQSPPSVVIRPLGTGSLRFDEAMPSGLLLALSTAAPGADPILGFIGWDGPMLKNMIGGLRMPRGATTVHGLPTGKIYVALFANDNVPGFGAAEVEIFPDRMATLDVPIVASWSDGHHDPPERLLPLFEEVKLLREQEPNRLLAMLKEHSIDLTDAKNPFDRQRRISQYLTKKIRLPSGTEAAYADLLAVSRYQALQRLLANRRAKKK